MSSTITAASSNPAVNEGSGAIATFNVSPQLNAAVTVGVSINGIGATAGVDYRDLWVSFDNWATNTQITNGRVTLPAGTTSFQLSTQTLADNVQWESSESVSFVVNQLSHTDPLVNSWYVASNVAINDTTTVPSTTTVTPSTITAASSNPAVNEGSGAIATFNVSPQLNAAVTVGVSINGIGATAGVDYRDLWVSFDNWATNTQITNGRVTLPAGTTSFQLSTQTLADNVQWESSESVSFVVNQLSHTDPLVNSWYVASNVAINDTTTVPSTTTVTPSTITAASSNPAVNEGSGAIATFNVSPQLNAAVTVGVSINGIGATAGVDYRDLWVSFDNWATNTQITNGRVTLPAGTTSFQLSTQTLADNVQWESSESVSFVVNQLSHTDPLVNSWYVASNVAINDTTTVPSTTPVTTSSITAGTNAAVNEGAYAVASFNISPVLSAPVTVGVSINGIGATAGSDYNGLQISTDNGGTWTNVSGSQVTLASGLSSFQLRTKTETDSVQWESSESVSFVVNQLSHTDPLVNSWYVASNVAINDTTGTPASPSTVTASLSVVAEPLNITEGASATTDGSGTWSAAISKFQLSTALTETATFAAGRFGFSATIADDISGNMAYRTAPSSSNLPGNWATAWIDLNNGGTVTVPAGHTYIEVLNRVIDDTVVENTENYAVVLQQTSSNLTNSWWVTNTVVITDNDSAPSTTNLTKVNIAPGATTTINEGQAAVATYTLSDPLAANASINVIALGWDATPNADYGHNTLQYRLMDATGTVTSTGSTNNLSTITLTQGTKSFELSTNTIHDSVSPEATETLEFVVSQTAASSNVIENSWWQSSLVKIVDVNPAP